jgi:hypothetical protein
MRCATLEPFDVTPIPLSPPPPPREWRTWEDAERR